MQDTPEDMSKQSKGIIICCITYSTGITTFLAGVVTMALPVINADLHIPGSLELWYDRLHSFHYKRLDIDRS